jgi:hypothetical protein
MEVKLRNSDVFDSRDPAHPADRLSSNVVPKDPFQMALYFGMPLPQKITSPLLTLAP